VRRIEGVPDGRKASEGLEQVRSIEDIAEGIEERKNENWCRVMKILQIVEKRRKDEN